MNYDCRKYLEETPITSQEQFNDSDTYLNAEGNIINGCDWSYENQDDHILCNVEGLQDYYNQLDKEE